MYNILMAETLKSFVFSLHIQTKTNPAVQPILWSSKVRNIEFSNIQRIEQAGLRCRWVGEDCQTPTRCTENDGFAQGENGAICL